MLYDYIEYQEVLYARMVDTDVPIPWKYSFDYDGVYPVFLVDASMEVRTDRTYSATEIVGADGTRMLDEYGRIIYLFFDSATFVLSYRLP